MQEVEQLSALLQGWERAVEAGQSTPVLAQYELIRRLAPIQSILLQHLQPEQKSLKIVHAAGGLGVQTLLGTIVPLSDAKWSKIEACVEQGNCFNSPASKEVEN